MERVCKAFTAEGVDYAVGECGDFSKVRNYSRLLSQRFIVPHAGRICPCKQCKRKFSADEELQAHIRNVHSPDVIGDTT
jgi:hypothetical protein